MEHDRDVQALGSRRHDLLDIQDRQCIEISGFPRSAGSGFQPG
jgi:hypothetical protein